MANKMDKQQYKECIEDDINFLKKHLSEGLFNCLWCSHIVDVLRLSVDLLYSKELYNNKELAKVAEEYGIKEAHGEHNYVAAYHKYGFNEGAKWAFSQGVNGEGDKNGINDDFFVRAEQFIKQLSENDKIAIQLRKIN